jgi:hypothetical protein
MQFYTEFTDFHREGRLNFLPSWRSELRMMHIFHMTTLGETYARVSPRR